MAGAKKSWRTVSGFDLPADEVFGAFDRYLREAGIEAQRFALAPSDQAILITARPERDSDAIWRLNPEPIGGAVIALSQDVGEQAAAQLRKQIRRNKSVALCRVCPRGRVGESPGHLKGREAWFQRRQKDDD